jgi:hypothetical protein
MAIIQNYPTGTPKNGDYLLGTSTPTINTDDLPVTQNFAISDVLGLASTSYIKSEKIVVSTDELKALHTTPKILVDVTAGNPKELCQVYSVIFNVGSNFATNKLTFPNDITIQSNNANPWKYIIPQATANDQFTPFYVPSLTAGLSGLDSDVVLSSAGAAVETGTARTTMTVWITYRIFEINA